MRRSSRARRRRTPASCGTLPKARGAAATAKASATRAAPTAAVGEGLEAGGQVEAVHDVHTVDANGEAHEAQGITLLMVAAGAILSTIAWWNMEPLWAIGILLAFAAIDLVLYVAMPDVLVCSRCQSRHRKAEIAKDHPRFDL